MSLRVAVPDDGLRGLIATTLQDLGQRQDWPSPIQLAAGDGQVVVVDPPAARAALDAHPRAMVLVVGQGLSGSGESGTRAFGIPCAAGAEVPAIVPVLLGLAWLASRSPGSDPRDEVLRSEDLGLDDRRFTLSATACEWCPAVVLDAPTLTGVDTLLNHPPDTRLPETWEKRIVSAVTPPPARDRKDRAGRLDPEALARWSSTPVEKIETPEVSVAPIARAMEAAVEREAGRIAPKDMRDVIAARRAAILDLVEALRSAAAAGVLQLPEARAVLKRLAAELASIGGSDPGADPTGGRARSVASRWIAEEWKYAKDALRGPTRAAGLLQAAAFGLALGSVLALVPFTSDLLAPLGPPLSATRAGAATLGGLLGAGGVGLLNGAARQSRVAAGYAVLDTMRADVAALDEQLAGWKVSMLDRLARTATADARPVVASILDLLDLAASGFREEVLLPELEAARTRLETWKGLRAPWHRVDCPPPGAGAAEAVLADLQAAWLRGALGIPPDPSILLVQRLRRGLRDALDRIAARVPVPDPAPPPGPPTERSWRLAGAGFHGGGWEPCPALPRGLRIDLRVETFDP